MCCSSNPKSPNDFNQLNRWLEILGLTRIFGRLRIHFLYTRSDWAGCGSNPNPIRPNTWTTLSIIQVDELTVETFYRFRISELSNIWTLHPQSQFEPPTDFKNLLNVFFIVASLWWLLWLQLLHQWNLQICFETLWFGEIKKTWLQNPMAYKRSSFSQRKLNSWSLYLCVMALEISLIYV